MPTRRDIRRLAMQVLYQFDVRGQADTEHIREGMEDYCDSAESRQEVFELAQAAWDRHEQADTDAAELAPQWPTHRQPPVDRAILRLAYYEIVSGHAPARVAINEAVALAKQFGSEQSPGFVNGVLDKIAKRLAKTSDPLPTKTPPTP